MAIFTVAACGDDGGDSSGDNRASDPAEAAEGTEDALDTEVIEIPVDVSEDAGRVVGVAGIDDRTVAVTAGGAVFESENGTEWDVVDASGLPEPPDDEAEVDEESTIGGMAAGPDGLVAVGTLTFFVADSLPEQLVWTSDDGQDWEMVRASGLDGTGLGAVAADDALLASGPETDESVTALWRSDDGSSWDVIEPAGLEAETGYRLVEVSSLAVVGDVVLATAPTQCDDCDDDFTALWRSEDGGETWEPLDESDGLESLQRTIEEPPLFVGLDDGFAVIGGGGDGESPVLTIWTSTDGETWTEGASLPDAALRSVDAATDTDDGVVALALEDGVLSVVRLPA